MINKELKNCKVFTNDFFEKDTKEEKEMGHKLLGSGNFGKVYQIGTNKTVKTYNQVKLDSFIEEI